MSTKVTWGFQDDAGDKAYAGCTLGSAVTDGQATTFIAILAGLSDGGVSQRQVATVTDLVASPEATSAVERRGTVILKNTADGRRWPITVLSIDEANIDKNGNAPRVVAAAACELIRAGFVAMSGLTDANIVVSQSFISESRK